MTEPKGSDGTKMNGEVTYAGASHAILKSMKLADWLGQFAVLMGADVPGRPPKPMTPFRQGAITKLKMSSEYMRQIETELFWLSRDNKGLRRQVEHLGGTVPPPFRRETEDVHASMADNGATDDDRSKDGSDDDQGGNGR